MDDINNTKKILIIGMSYFMQTFMNELSRPCIAIDSNELLGAHLQEKWQENPNITVYTGDANSIVLWKKLPLDELSHIVFSITDDDVAEELCRIAREIFKLDLPIIAISRQNHDQREFYTKYNITNLNPIAVGISALQIMIEHNYALPSNIGLGKGEIVEVSILRPSHLIGRKLRYMESSSWKVGAIYRDNELLLPNANSELHIGDRVVLMGDPTILKNIMTLLMQGVPQFPLQYGQYINLLVDSNALMEEANYLQIMTQAKGLRCFGKARDIAISQASEIKSLSSSEVKNYRDPAIFKDAGIVALPVPSTFWINLRLRWYLRHQTAPLLISKKVSPYTAVIALFNSNFPAQVLQVALEISRLGKLPLSIVYVAAPKALRNARMESELTDRLHIIKDFESIERLKLEYNVLEGNPIRKIMEYQRDYPKALIITDNNPENRINPFEPHIPYLLAQRSPCSMLVLPVASE